MERMVREFKIHNELGLHARPAALIVQKISPLDCDVLIECSGEKVNAKSIMGILMLAIEHGKTIIVHASGADAEQALLVIEELIEDRFGEE